MCCFTDYAGRNPGVKQRSPRVIKSSAIQLGLNSVFWDWKGLTGCMGTAALHNLLVLQLLSSRYWHQTAQQPELAEKLAFWGFIGVCAFFLWLFFLSSSFGGQNYSFQSEADATRQWGEASSARTQLEKALRDSGKVRPCCLWVHPWIQVCCFCQLVFIFCLFCFHHITKLQWSYGLSWIYESQSTWRFLKQKMV